MRRGEKNLMTGKNGGVKRAKTPRQTKGCRQATPKTLDTIRSAITDPQLPKETKFLSAAACSRLRDY